MILTKEMIGAGKALRKKRTNAVQLLNRLAKAGGLPEPLYDHRAGGSAKHRSHYYKVQFRVPEFIRSDPDYDHFQTSIIASGRDKQKGYARSLAALEAVLFLEESLNLHKGSLMDKIESYEKQQEEKKKEIQSSPVETEVPGVSWENLPIDMAFQETEPAGRRGCLEFSADLRKHQAALAAAKAFTLCSMNELPDVKVHSNQTDDPSQLQQVSSTQYIRCIDVYLCVVYLHPYTIHVITFIVGSHPHSRKSKNYFRAKRRNELGHQ